MRVALCCFFMAGAASAQDVTVQEEEYPQNDRIYSPYVEGNFSRNDD